MSAKGWRIGTVSRMTGIPKATLIAWERRYGLPDPSRTGTGHRTFGPDDVAVLLKVKGWLEQGFRIGEAVRMLETPVPTGPGPSALARVRDEVLERLLAYDSAGADRAAAALGTASFEDVLEQVYLPVLREVGDRWHRGEATVAQEHHATGWCRERMTAMRQQVNVDRPGAPHAILATPTGERHELGLLAIAVQLQLRGWRVTWLGPDVPTDALCGVVAAHRPRLVGLSAVIDTLPESLREIARAVADAAPEAHVLVGGCGSIGVLDEANPRIRYGATLADVEALDSPAP